jgi:hypothetical protein
MKNPTIPTLDDSENLSEKAARAWESSAGNDTAGAADSALGRTKEKAAEVLHSGERLLREHPGTSALGVFSAGMLVGALVAWSIAREQRDDTSDRIHRLLTRLGRKLNLD